MTQIQTVGYAPSASYVTQSQPPVTPSAEELARLAGTDSASLATVFSSGDGVSQEQIMGLLQHRVANIDAEIQGLMSGVDERTAQAQELQRRHSALLDLQQAVAELPSSEGQVVVDGLEVDGVPIRDFLSDHGLAGEVTFIHEDGQTKISKEALDKLATKIGEEQRAANSGNELDLIRLQDAVERRSQTIMLATNMIKSIHETLKAIVSNLR